MHHRRSVRLNFIENSKMEIFLLVASSLERSIRTNTRTTWCDQRDHFFFFWFRSYYFTTFNMVRISKHPRRRNTRSNTFKSKWMLAIVLTVVGISGTFTMMQKVCKLIYHSLREHDVVLKRWAHRRIWPYRHSNWLTDYLIISLIRILRTSPNR
jgi:hypothetical protein